MPLSRAYFLFWIVALVAGSTAACGPSTEPIPRLSSVAVILAFGDSLTFGTGANTHQSYPAVLETLTGRTVVNAGKPGEVSADGLRRLPREVQSEDPDLVILCHGGNDFLRKLDRSKTKKNLISMIEYLREEEIPVVMLGVPDFGLFLNTADIYLEVAEEMGVPIEADVIPDVLEKNRYKSDQIHPNAAGYELMAETIKALLEQNGAL